MIKKVVSSILLVLVTCCPAFAIPVEQFRDTDRYIGWSKDIIVAQCVSILPPKYDGCSLVDVNILKVIVGERNPGIIRITTIYKMEPNVTYLLASSGCSLNGTDFCATGQLSVVPLHRGFKLEELDGKNIREQIQYIFSRRLFELERQLRPILEEKELLEKGVSDRSSVWYESKIPVKIGPIVECNAQSDDTYPKWLEIDTKKLMCSRISRHVGGLGGGLGFEKIGSVWTPYWEFSPCDVNNIEDISGKPLNAKFYGLFTPGRCETSLGCRGGLQYIDVLIGRIVLARTVDEPGKIYIIQIISQKENKEQMSARYAVINP